MSAKRAAGYGLIVPSVRVYKSTNQSITNNTVTAITFSTVRWDPFAMWSSGSNTRLTCKVAGTYLIWGCVEYASNSTGIRQTGIRLNGATNLSIITDTPCLTNVSGYSISTVYQLVVTDYVELTVYHNITGGGALNVDAAVNYSPEFSATLFR